MEKRGYPRWAHFLSLFSFPYLSQKCNWNMRTVYIYRDIKERRKRKSNKNWIDNRLLKTREKIDENIFLKMIKLFLFFFFFFGKLIRWLLSRFLAKKVPRSSLSSFDPAKRLTLLFFQVKRYLTFFTFDQ